MPVFIDIARQQALAEAPEEVAQLARQIRSDDDPRFPITELIQFALTRFPARILEAASSGDPDAAVLADQIRQLWRSAEVQRFLLRETAAGWPEHLRKPTEVFPARVSWTYAA